MKNQITLTPLIICFTILFLSMNAYAQEETQEREITISHGKPYDVCHAFLRGMIEHKIQKPMYCGVPLPSDDPDFTLLDWKSVDPLEHLNVIRGVTISANFKVNNAGVEHGIMVSRAKRFFAADDFPQEDIDLLWTPYKEEIIESIKAGELKVWKAIVDSDSDGKLEPIYKMSRIGVANRGVKKINGVLRELPEDYDNRAYISTSPNCTDIGLTNDVGTYFYYVSKKDSPSGYWHLLSSGMGDTHTELFKWRNRLFYMYNGASIHESQPIKKFMMETGNYSWMTRVCGFKYK